MKNLIAAVLLLFGASVHAAPVTWYLDALYEDFYGGVSDKAVWGSFHYDPESGVFSNINIVDDSVTFTDLVCKALEWWGH